MTRPLRSSNDPDVGLLAPPLAQIAASNPPKPPSSNTGSSSASREKTRFPFTPGGGGTAKPRNVIAATVAAFFSSHPDHKCCTPTSDQDYSGGDLDLDRTLTWEGCCERCSKERLCKLWTFLDGVCYLKTTSAEKKFKHGAISGCSLLTKRFFSIQKNVPNILVFRRELLLGRPHCGSAATARCQPIQPARGHSQRHETCMGWLRIFVFRSGRAQAYERILWELVGHGPDHYRCFIDFASHESDLRVSACEELAR